MRKILAILIVVSLLLSLAACSQVEEQVIEDSNETESTETASVENDSQVEENTTSAEPADEVSSLVDTSKYEYTDIGEDYSALDVSSEKIEITSGGTYLLEGEMTGQIYIETDEEVRLVLNGFSILSESGPAINVENAESVTISMVDGTVNTITDSTDYDGYDEDVTGAIYSKDDLVLNGSGQLYVYGMYNNAIVSNDDLLIIGANLIADSVDDGILGSDSVVVSESTLKLEVAGDGLRASNEEDSEKGFVYITDSTIDIESGSDAIQAANIIQIDSGNITIESESKGIKSAGNLLINSGNIAVNSVDDSLHAQGTIQITGGEITLSSDDDGIHSDTSVDISGGSIDVLKSYEGLESIDIVISGGEININASDDGINVADGSGEMNRPGSMSDSGMTLVIEGGAIYVNADGDGVDVNGSIEMTGGTLYVNGPTGNGNGALDYDGTFNISGGEVIATGSAGMAMAPSESSAQYSVLVYFESVYSAGNIVSLVDESGNVLLSASSEKSFQTVALSSQDIKDGSTYKILVDDEEVYSFTAEGTTTYLGSGGMMGGRPGQGMDRKKPGM